MSEDFCPNHNTVEIKGFCVVLTAFKNDINLTVFSQKQCLEYSESSPDYTLFICNFLLVMKYLLGKTVDNRKYVFCNLGELTLYFLLPTLYFLIILPPFSL